MRTKRFLISSLLVAGLIPPMPVKAALGPEFSLENPKNKATLFEVFKRGHVFDLAAHRSHSSHRSHASHQSHVSHQSHRSSTGGGYNPPLPNTPNRPYEPPSLPTTPDTPTFPLTGGASSPAAEGGAVTLPGNAAKFTNIVILVQTALYSYGYYSGPLTGVVDEATKLAISDMQAQFGLTVNGKITADVLDALSITAE